MSDLCETVATIQDRKYFSLCGQKNSVKWTNYFIARLSTLLPNNQNFRDNKIDFMFKYLKIIFSLNRPIMLFYGLNFPLFLFPEGSSTGAQQQTIFVFMRTHRRLVVKFVDSDMYFCLDVLHIDCRM